MIPLHVFLWPMNAMALTVALASIISLACSIFSPSKLVSWIPSLSIVLCRSAFSDCRADAASLASLLFACMHHNDMELNYLYFVINIHFVLETSQVYIYFVFLIHSPDHYRDTLIEYTHSVYTLGKKHQHWENNYMLRQTTIIICAWNVP